MERRRTAQLSHILSPLASVLRRRHLRAMNIRRYVRIVWRRYCRSSSHTREPRGDEYDPKSDHQPLAAALLAAEQRVEELKAHDRESLRIVAALTEDVQSLKASLDEIQVTKDVVENQRESAVQREKSLES